MSMKLNAHGKPTIIDMSQDYGATLRIFASSYQADKPTGVSVQFDVETRDFTASFTADTPAKLDRIIIALMKARNEV